MAKHRLDRSEHVAMGRRVFTEWLMWKKLHGPKPLETEGPSCDR